LLTAGAKAERLDGDSPLLRAVIGGKTEIARTLLLKGADKNRVDSHGRSLLHYAVDLGEPELLKMLIFQFQKEKGVIDRPDSSGVTPLHHAIKKDNHLALNALITAGANPNIPDTQGMTPLALALQNGHFKMVTELLKNGGDPSYTASNGVSILNFAEMVAPPETVLELIHYGANPNIRRAVDGTTLLHRAVTSRRMDIVKELIQNKEIHTKIDKEIRDHWGLTPLMWAVAQGQSEMVKVLLGWGASPAQVFGNGQSILEYAKNYPDQDIRTEMIQLIQNKLR